jgi:hypothetical protein
MRLLEMFAKRMFQMAKIAKRNIYPAERAKEALRANPSASVTDVVKLAKVNRSTVVRARKKLVAAVEPEPEPVDPEQETKKKVERFRATIRKTFATLTKQWLEEIGFDAMKEIIRDETKAWLGAVAGTGMALNVEVAD